MKAKVADRLDPGVCDWLVVKSLLLFIVIVHGSEDDEG
jgi:hypothetical protein